MQDQNSAPAAAQPASCSKPFLRRNSGWEARVAAAREGRRYVPRGGPIKDYSLEEEVPLPRRRHAAAGSRAGRAPPVGKHGRADGARSAAPTHPPAGQQHLHLHHHAARHAAAAASPAARPAALLRQPSAHPAAAAAARSKDWGHRTTQGGRRSAAAQPPQQQQQQHQRSRAASRPEERHALQVFEALERQVAPPHLVLREVGNSPTRQHRNHQHQHPLQGAPASAGKKVAPGSGPFGHWPPPPAGSSSSVGEGDEEGDVYQSDDGSGQMSYATGGAPLAPWPHAAGAARWLAGDDEQEDEGECLQAEVQSSFVQDAMHHAGHLHQYQQQQETLTRRAAHPAAAAPPPAFHRPLPQQHQDQQQQQQRQPPLCERDAVEELQAEVVRLQEERARAARLRLELQEAAAKLERDRAAHEKRKLEEAARFEAERGEELRKLQRDRRVLEKQSRAILKMPTKQSKEEVAAVEALLQEERRTARAREARSKLALERLRQQLEAVQARNTELREQVMYLEQQYRLQLLAQQPAQLQQVGGAGRAAAAVVGMAVAGAAAAAPTAAAMGPAGTGTSRQRPPAVRVERGDPHHSRVGTGSVSVSAASAGAAISAPPTSTGAPAALLEQQPAVQPSQAGGWANAECVDECGNDGDEAEEGEGEDAEGIAAEMLISEGEVVQPEEEQAPQHVDEIVEPPQQQQEQQQEWQQVAAAVHAQPCMAGGTGSGAGAGTALPHEVPAAAHPAAAAPGSPNLPTGLSVRWAALPPSDDLRRLGRTLLASTAAAAGAPPLQDDGIKAVDSLPIPAAAAASVAGAPGPDGDAVVSEQRHPDGRWELLYASGLREQRFLNGSTKQQLPPPSPGPGVGQGASLTRFANGDVKKVLPGGDSDGGTVVEYFYAEVGSWQVTHPSGVDCYYFPSGQVEAHHPGAVKEIRFADGALRKALPDGRELALSAAHLSREIQRPVPVASLV